MSLQSSLDREGRMWYRPAGRESSCFH